jgi:hypothetical protein
MFGRNASGTSRQVTHLIERKIDKPEPDVRLGLGIAGRGISEVFAG